MFLKTEIIFPKSNIQSTGKQHFENSEEFRMKCVGDEVCWCNLLAAFNTDEPRHKFYVALLPVVSKYLRTSPCWKPQKQILFLESPCSSVHVSVLDAHPSFALDCVGHTAEGTKSRGPKSLQSEIEAQTALPSLHLDGLNKYSASHHQDGKIQITILILRQGPCLTKNSISPFTFYQRS